MTDRPTHHPAPAPSERPGGEAPAEAAGARPAVADPVGRRLLAIARRVAEAHRGLDDGSLIALVSGSTVDGLADERSDVDMSIVWDELPDEAVLRAACRRAGGGDWTWQLGPGADGGRVVAFELDGVEVQIGYTGTAALDADLDELLVAHTADTPNHKLAEGLLKAIPLAGAERLAARRARLADFPDALGRAMVVHGLEAPVPWRAVCQIIHRDAALWCREIQVEAVYRLLLVLCGLNGRYFTRFQVKRQARLAASLRQAPPDLAARLDAVLAAPPARAFAVLHALEGEVLALVARQHPDIDLAALHRRRAAFDPADVA
jgi:DNA-binding transcriptional regulator YdaS (Cro superfamily)